MDPFLEEDESRPRKQRHTASRILERLRDEHGFTGGYTSVKDYVRECRLRMRKMPVPLVQPAGQAQADFGEALVEIRGVERKGHFLAIDLPRD
jgi:transposase